MSRFKKMFIITKLFICLAIMPTFLSAAMRNEHRITIDKAFYDRKSIASLRGLSKFLSDKDIRIKIMHDYMKLEGKEQVCEKMKMDGALGRKVLFSFPDLMALDACYFEGINLLNTIYRNDYRWRSCGYNSHFNENACQKVCDLPLALKNKFKIDGIASFDLYVNGVLKRIHLDANQG